MSKIKEFLEVNKLIETIKSKGIKIDNEEKVKDILMKNNYYVIMGYKSLFLDKKHNSFKAKYSVLDKCLSCCFWTPNKTLVLGCLAILISPFLNNNYIIYYIIIKQ